MRAACPYQIDFYDALLGLSLEMACIETTCHKSRKWLPHKDLNLDKLIQNQLCYRYTMRQ